MQITKKIAAGIAAVALFQSVVGAATIDKTTSGNWIGKYGSDGYILCDYANPGGGGTLNSAIPVNDVQQLPSYISSYDYSAGTLQYVWVKGENDTRDPQDPANPTGPRNATTSFNTGDFSVTLHIAQTKTFNLEVYGLDWDNYNGRDALVTVQGQTVEFNGANGYNNPGEYGIWTVNATAGQDVTINLHQLASQASNTVISGIFFDSVPEPASVGLMGVVALGMLARRRRV